MIGFIWPLFMFLNDRFFKSNWLVFQRKFLSGQDSSTYVIEVLMVVYNKLDNLMKSVYLFCQVSAQWDLWSEIITSATTRVSVSNTRVFRTALTDLTEPRTLWRRITHYPPLRRWVALHMYLLNLLVTYTHHQNDMCVTLFAVAAVMLKPFFLRPPLLWKCCWCTWKS